MTGDTDISARASAGRRRFATRGPDAWTLALLAVPLVIAVLMLVFLGADPARGVTGSNGPFTDESWDVMNARNLVLLGTWATDDWTLHLVNMPFSVSAAAVFSVLGVGIEQGRLVSVVATLVTLGALGAVLRRHVGGGPALLAVIALGFSTLVLYYGRLAFLEPMVSMWLTLGALTVLLARGPRAGRWGIAAGVLLALGVGTKPSALASAVGMLVAVGIVGFRQPSVRRWVAGSAAAIGVAGAAWAALVWLPNRSAISGVLRIWASEPIIAPIRTVLRRVLAYPLSNDGFLVASAPLVAAGAAGWALAVWARRRLTPELRLLVALATGWIVFGLGLLAVAPYRPNRYEVPILPAFAILVGVGARVADDAARTRWPRWRQGRLPVVAGTLLAVVLIAPGLAAFATWMANATYRLPEIQAQLQAEVPAGSVSQGDYAPAFLMRAPAVTIVSRPATNISAGDLYATRGVRWVVTTDGQPPQWAAQHPDAWAARRQVLCSPWGTANVCVWQLP
jgi:4-amino-4-deoxy-L-arabinose transferase-like glycosyltransferase